MQDCSARGNALLQFCEIIDFYCSINLQPQHADDWLGLAAKAVLHVAAYIGLKQRAPAAFVIQQAEAARSLCLLLRPSAGLQQAAVHVCQALLLSCMSTG